MQIFVYQRSRLSFCCLFSALESNRLNGLVPSVGSNTKITQKCYVLPIAKVSANLSIVMDQKKNFQLLFFPFWCIFYLFFEVSMDFFRGFRCSFVEIKENCMQIYMVVSCKLCSLNNYGILFSLATPPLKLCTAITLFYFF